MKERRGTSLDVRRHGARDAIFGPQTRLSTMTRHQMPPISSRIPALAGLFLLVAGLAPSGLHGQPALPGGHFGALTIPAHEAGTHLALTLDRFTPNGQPDDPGQYNDIDRTIGFNMLSYSVAATIDRWPGLTRRFTLQLGWGHDQPTEWMQNTLHRMIGKGEVPSIDPRNNALDAVATAELAMWAPVDAPVRQFLAAGIGAGTPYSEAWTQIGAVGRLGSRGPELLGSIKVGAPILGGVFPESTISDVYGSFEARIELPVAEWFDVSWLPSPFLGAQYATGFFLSSAGDPIPERHGSYGATAADGRWRLEFWNEHYGGLVSDKGPTGGGRFMMRLPAG